MHPDAQLAGLARAKPGHHRTSPGDLGSPAPQRRPDGLDALGAGHADIPGAGKGLRIQLYYPRLQL